MSILVAYASRHGSTAEVAERIARRLSERGLAAEARAADQVVDVDIYDAVIIGSPIYYGSWMKEAVEFVTGNRSWLAERPTWLFSVGPLGSFPDDLGQQPKELGELRSQIAPRDHVTFFGRLDPERLSFPERMMVRAIGSPTGDFRSWETIDRWADAVARELASPAVQPSLPAAPPGARG